MKFKAHINIMPLEALLDPQGKAVSNGLKNLGLGTIDHVRIGKHITLFVDAANESKAMKLVEEACTKLLVNQVMEYYEFRVEKAE